MENEVFASSDGTEKLLSEDQSANGYYVRLARTLKVSVRTIHDWVKAGRILQPTYFGNRAFWSEKAIEQILAEGTQPPGTYPPKHASRLARLAAAKVPLDKRGQPKRSAPQRNEPTRKPAPKQKPTTRNHHSGGRGKGGRG